MIIILFKSISDDFLFYKQISLSNTCSIFRENYHHHELNTSISSKKGLVFKGVMKDLIKVYN